MTTPDNEPTAPDSPVAAPVDDEDYGLADDAGNQALGRLLAEVRTAVSTGEASRYEAAVALGDGVRELSRDWPDITDITVRTSILRALNPVFAQAGMAALEPFDF